ncbi:hypothetical protein FKR81_03740 [Lentzea tibetensis]|uniref:Uncharacterized protein n=1 Tax=Lentzea tibetensis TaxID=2591470 RepID=A0A563F2B2_9PSEU|nr:leucine-rich repeat domain-containing protein [Lentzea tibetensis]TWP53878.1 hypothetical protein FKR81_03740 [Lentzea tibetensis]
MTASTAANGYRIVDVDEAEERFSLFADVESRFPYREFSDEQEFRLYEGGLHVTGDFSAETDGDWVPYNVIVDGDLTVDGDLSWWDDHMGNFVLVTGNVRARNVLLCGNPTVVVRGDLLVDNGVFGCRGEDGGFLDVGGVTRAKTIVNIRYFKMTFSGGRPDATLVADPSFTSCSADFTASCPVDFADDELSEVLLPAMLDPDGYVDEGQIEWALVEGRPILRPGAVPSHLAALAELDALRARSEEVVELDLADRNLREFPEQLFAFPNLGKLSLAGNDEIHQIPERIAELTALEELDLSGLALKRLPAAIGRLEGLRVLDISGNPLRDLPDELGTSPALTVLRARSLNCPIPESFAPPALEELDLSRLRSADGFPHAVTRLARLRTLDLTEAVLGEIPGALLGLTALEELRLDGALGGVPRLPDLAALPRLRVLHVNGHDGDTGRYPDHDLLDAVWPITTLEELNIGRWGAGRHDRRPALTGLPDHAFAAMQGLRRLDLSRNELSELPESFYQLRQLQVVDLHSTSLDRPTLDRLAETFPQVQIDLRGVPTRNDVDDPNWRAVHDLVTNGQAKLGRDHPAAVQLFEEALDRCGTGASFSDHDQLYAYYGLVYALSRLVDADEGLTDRLIGYAERALAMVPEPGEVWHFTDEGQFQEEVTRTAGNSLAWQLMKRGELDRALSIVERALTFGADPAYDYLRDTKVRILLAMGRAAEAYLVVDHVLTRNPDFSDFADFTSAPEFLHWRAANTLT